MSVLKMDNAKESVRTILQTLDDEVVRALVRMVQIDPKRKLVRIKVLRSACSGMDLKSAKDILDLMGDPFERRTLYQTNIGEGSGQFQTVDWVGLSPFGLREKVAVLEAEVASLKDTNHQCTVKLDGKDTAIDKLIATVRASTDALDEKAVIIANLTERLEENKRTIQAMDVHLDALRTREIENNRLILDQKAQITYGKAEEEFLKGEILAVKAVTGKDLDDLTAQVKAHAENIEKAQKECENKVIRTYEIGEVINARVIKITNFGVIVRTKDGVEGLIHMSELSSVKINHPSEVLAIDDWVFAKIIKIDETSGDGYGSKLGFSLRRLHEDSASSKDVAVLKQKVEMWKKDAEAERAFRAQDAVFFRVFKKVVLSGITLAMDEVVPAQERCAFHPVFVLLGEEV